MEAQRPLPALSVVIPVFNEEENIAPLAARLEEALKPWGAQAEVVFVDDGSSDRTLAELRRVQAADPRILILHFRKNLGQTAAMEAGFHHSRGDAVVTLDGDLQNDPADIQALVERLREYDVVCGVRERRRDTWMKRISSRIANGVRNWATGDDIVDTGCTLKAFQGRHVRTLKLYDGMHRFLPTLLKFRGCRVLQIPVGHHLRFAGATKYGTWGRLIKGIQDLFAVRWMKKNWIEYASELEIERSPATPSGGPHSIGPESKAR